MKIYEVHFLYITYTFKRVNVFRPNSWNFFSSGLVIQISSLNRPRAKEVPAIGMKNVYTLKSLSEAEELYF